MIRLSNVSKYYHENGNVSCGLRHINLEFKRNEFVAIVGPSGAGKTTLLNVISGMDTYEEGEMYYHEQETSYFTTENMEEFRKEHVGFVFQNYNLIDSYTVLENVELPLILKGNYTKKQRREIALNVLKRVGLENRIHHRGTKLSGGEKQRVVIARALASDADILACDEPTGNLDSKTGHEILELLKEISKDKLVLLVTHDFEAVKPYATRVIRVFDGEIQEDSSLCEVQTQEEIAKPLQSNPLKFKNLFSIAMHNLKCTPKKTILSFLVYLVLSFFVACCFIATIPKSLLNYTGDRDFSNISENRVVISKRDKQPFTSEELSSLRNKNHVKELIGNDYFLDTTISNDGAFNENTEVYLNGTILPSSLLKEKEIIAGRLPNLENEIVVPYTSKYDFNSYTMEEFLAENPKIFFYGANDLEFHIVGFVKNDEAHSNFIYGKEDLKKVAITNSLYKFFNISLETENESSGFSDVSIEMNFHENSDKVIIKTSFIDSSDSEKNLKLSTNFYTITIPKEKIEFQYDESLYFDEISIGWNLFQEYDSQDIYQVSVWLENGYYASSFLNSIGHEYITWHVSKAETNTTLYLIVLIINIVLIVQAAVDLLIYFFISYLVLSLILRSKKKDYSVMRALGLNKKNMNSIVILENLILAFFSFCLVTIGIILFVNLVPYSQIHTFISPDLWLKLLIFFIALMLITYLLGKRFNKKLFQVSVSDSFRE